MSKFLNNKLFRYLSVFLFLNYAILPAKSSSALAAWTLKTNGVLELRTKSNTNLKAYFQTANQVSGDRFWIDFPGELKNPRTIKGNGPIKEIRLGKPNKGKTRLVIEFKEETYLKPLTWQMVGLDQNRWRIKLFNSKYSFKKIGEGLVEKKRGNIKANQNVIHKKKNNYGYLKLPEVKRNKFEVVIDPGHGGPDPGAIGIGGIRETDVVLEVSKIVKNLLSEKGVKVKLTRKNEVDLDLPPRVSFANNTDADIFVSIHANASRGKRKDINGLETFYFIIMKGCPSTFASNHFIFYSNFFIHINYCQICIKTLFYKTFIFNSKNFTWIFTHQIYELI